MHKLLSTAFCIALIAPTVAAGESMDSLYEAAVFENADGEKLPYRLLSPIDLKPGEKYPLLLFLHGAGERGDDNARQLIHVAAELADEALRQRYPAYVLIPQCPQDQKWADVDWTRNNHEMTPEPSRPMSLALGLLDWANASLPIDRDRIYVGGLSMGGFGTWDLLQREPHRFAAAVPICGGGDPRFAAAFAEIPVWTFHGADDPVVKPQRSREMVEAVRAASGNIIYTEYPGVAHNSWTMTAQNRLVWDWLFAQTRIKK